MGEACLLGQQSGPSPGLYTPLRLLAARMLASTVSTKPRGLTDSESRLQFLPALQPHLAWAEAKGGQA